MKLLRVGEPGYEKPALLDNKGVIRDLSGVISDLSGAALASDSLETLSTLDVSLLPELASAIEKIRIGPCVGSPGKFICIGKNYADHAREMGGEPPKEPVIFDKWLSAISGPNDPIIQPRGSTKLDWEVELGLVIGREGSYIDASAAGSHIAGFCLINDVSERAFQKERGGQWIKGKGCDSFGPIGPWLATQDEFDASNVELWLDVNGERQQQDSTANMIFKPDFLVSYVSQFMTLLPGDIIATGTPSGVGAGQNPPRFLKAGDVVELGIEGLGVQTHTVVPAA